MTMSSSNAAPSGATIALLCLWHAAVAPLPLAGAAMQARLTVAEALELAFPDAKRIERRTAFLSEADLEEARRLAGREVDVEHSLVTYYVGVGDSGPLGVAYFDAHRVRTLPEVLMFVVSPDSRITRIETLKFQEPPEYIAPDGWLEQFYGGALSELSLKGAGVNMTGASLTSLAVTRAARRVLALHRVIRPLDTDEEAESR